MKEGARLRWDLGWGTEGAQVETEERDPLSLQAQFRFGSSEWRHHAHKLSRFSPHRPMEVSWLEVSYHRYSL